MTQSEIRLTPVACLQSEANSIHREYGDLMEELRHGDGINSIRVKDLLEFARVAADFVDQARVS